MRAEIGELRSVVGALKQFSEALLKKLLPNDPVVERVNKELMQRAEIDLYSTPLIQRLIDHGVVERARVLECVKESDDLFSFLDSIEGCGDWSQQEMGTWFAKSDRVILPINQFRNACQLPP